MEYLLTALVLISLLTLIIGEVVLPVEGWHPEKTRQLYLKNDVHFGMAFSFSLELMNRQWCTKSHKPVELHESKITDNV